MKRREFERVRIKAALEEFKGRWRRSRRKGFAVKLFSHLFKALSKRAQPIARGRERFATAESYYIIFKKVIIREKKVKFIGKPERDFIEYI